MKEMRGYEKTILVLTAVFMMACAALFWLGRSGQSYTVTVTSRTPDAELLTERTQDNGTPDSLIPGEKIDLNTAPPLDLARLPGIGQTRADAIAAYRTQYGPFETVEELLQVDGIGEVTLEKLREYVKIG